MLKIKHRQCAFDIKRMSEKGKFDGYASIFNNTDLGRDVVMPGAFSKSLADWKDKGKYPPILWQHSASSPIGPFTDMAEDGKGLYCEGQLLINDVQQAKEAYALIKAGAINGMSIGYQTVGQEYDGKTNVNKLTELALFEASIVTFPMNTEATVDQVKSLLADDELPTIRMFEAALREQGYSRKQAEFIAEHGFVEFLKQRDADEGRIDIDSVLAIIRDNPIKL